MSSAGTSAKAVLRLFEYTTAPPRKYAEAPGTASTLLTNLAKSGEVTKADRALKPPE